MKPPSFPLTPPAPAEEILRVLLVEGDAVDRMALCRTILSANLPYRLTEASSVAEARHRLELERFDALILDHHLPDGSGFELFAAAGETPVIFVTGAADTAFAVKALKAGAADYIIKDTERKYLGLLPHTLTRTVQERRMRTALHAAQNQVRQLLEMLPAAAFAFNAEGLITFHNRQVPVIWGYEPRPGDPADRFCGRVRLFHPDKTPLARESCWQALTEGRTVAGREMIVEDVRGQRHHVLSYANPLQDEDGVLTGAVVIWVDVTERRRLERQQRALESQLQHARQLEAVGTLAGGMAHEFNNLLTSILGNLQLAEMDVPEGHPAQPPLEKSVASCRRARDLVSRMQTFSEQAPATGNTGQLFFPETDGPSRHPTPPRPISPQ